MFPVKMLFEKEIPTHLNPFKQALLKISSVSCEKNTIKLQQFQLLTFNQDFNLLLLFFKQVNQRINLAISHTFCFPKLCQSCTFFFLDHVTEK